MKPVTQINFFSIKPGNRSCCRRSGRTGDEDIHRPPRALLPFRAGEPGGKRSNTFAAEISANIDTGGTAGYNRAQ